MAQIRLRIRQLQDGDVMVAEFPDEDVAEAWLRERPPFIEVLRMESAAPAEIEARLRAAMRPFDDEERGLQDAHQQRLLAQRTAELKGLMEPEPEPDAGRLMHVRWDRVRGLSLDDSRDDRTIPPAVYAAVDAWVRERDSWVVDRGEQVVAASLSVWPAAVPSGRESDRIEPGAKFVTGTLQPS